MIDPFCHLTYTQMALELRDIGKKYAGQTAVDGISLKIEQGEFFALLGPSGCGKSTLLRMISGVESPTVGTLWLEGQELTQMPSQKRPFNMVFQSYALFPHLTVEENLSFGPKIKKVAPEEIKQRVNNLLELVGLESCKDRLPETLSGGQQQRVALVRALINQPRVLLLDEPLSALDKTMRVHMQTELKLLQRKLGITFIFVTHDQEEAMSMADRIAIMNKGQIEQIGTPLELYESPQTSFVARFFGDSNFWKGSITEDEKLRIENFENRLDLPKAIKDTVSVGDTCDVFVKYEKIQVSKEGPGERVQLQEQFFQGPSVQLLLKTQNGFNVSCELSTHSALSLGLQIGSEYFLKVDSADLSVFSRAGS